MNEKELIRRALMGDKQAQQECTAKGIVLPCPFCGGNKIKTPYVCGEHFMECSSCHSASNIVSSRKQALKHWNTRPAPPIGRCWDCKHYRNYRHHQSCGDCWYHEKEKEATDFCSYFEPKEES